MVKRIKSSALLCGTTSNNCFTVYQKELSLLLVQASPYPLLIVFCNRPGDLLDSVKKGSYQKKLYKINLTEYQR
jgi:hypothetical protein